MSGANAVSERITTGLNKLIAADHRVIWWSDPHAEFADAITDLAVDGADSRQVHAQKRNRGRKIDGLDKQNHERSAQGRK